jgi:hypothetical protein
MKKFYKYADIIKITFTTPLFIASCILFILHQIGQWTRGSTCEFIDNYLDMVLLMPIIMTLWWTERSLIINQLYNIPKLECLLTFIVVGTISELVFPKLSTNFTPDPWDLVALFIGHTIFYFQHRRKIKILN